MALKSFWKLNIYAWGKGGLSRVAGLGAYLAGAYIPVLGLFSIPGTDVPPSKRPARLLVTVMVLLCCFTQFAVAAQSDIYAFSSEKENQRFLSLTKELRCLVCQNQSLADSDADLAKDLRNKIYVMMNEKKSDEEIRQYLVSRYGEFILFSPPLTPATLILWGFPVILLAGALGGLFLIFNHRASS